MVRGRKTKGLAVLPLLLIAASINATPKICNCNNAVAWQSLSPKPNLYVSANDDRNQIAELSNLSPIAIGEKFHKPSVNFTDSLSRFSGVHFLPAVPGAFTPAQSGVSPLSPVKDPRLWLVIFIGLFLAAQTGLRPLLQTASPVRCDTASRPFSHFHAAGVNTDERTMSCLDPKPAMDKGPLSLSIDIDTPEETFLLPGRTRRYSNAPAENSARVTHLKHSARLVLAELANCFTQRIDTSFNDIHLIVYFSFQTISAQLARGPPAPLEP